MASNIDRTQIFLTKGEWYVDPTAVDGTGGQGLGYTDTGFEIDIGEEVIEEPSDESGAQVVNIFYAGNRIVLRTVLKQWDDAVLKNLFPGQWDDTAKIVQFPGTRSPGDSMLGESVILLFVPDNPRVLGGGGSGKDPTVLALKAVCRKAGVVGMPFSNTRIRKVAVEFLLFPEESGIDDQDDQWAYRTLGIGPRDSLVIPT